MDGNLVQKFFGHTVPYPGVHGKKRDRKDMGVKKKKDGRKEKKKTKLVGLDDNPPRVCGARW